MNIAERATELVAALDRTEFRDDVDVPLWPEGDWGPDYAEFSDCYLDRVNTSVKVPEDRLEADFAEFLAKFFAGDDSVLVKLDLREETLVICRKTCGTPASASAPRRYR